MIAPTEEGPRTTCRMGQKTLAEPTPRCPVRKTGTHHVTHGAATVGDRRERNRRGPLRATASANATALLATAGATALLVTASANATALLATTGATALLATASANATAQLATAGATATARRAEWRRALPRRRVIGVAARPLAVPGGVLRAPTAHAQRRVVALRGDVALLAAVVAAAMQDGGDGAAGRRASRRKRSTGGLASTSELAASTVTEPRLPLPCSRRREWSRRGGSARHRSSSSRVGRQRAVGASVDVPPARTNHSAGRNHDQPLVGTAPSVPARNGL
jgi:hypothetical protein